MKHLTSICYLMLFLCYSMAQAQEIDIPGDYQWENRILLVYAESEKSPEYRNQLEEFERSQAAMNDRDLVVFSIFPQKVITPQEKSLSKKAANQLRRKYQPSDDRLTVVLIGKDGGEKLREGGFLTLDKLFGIIDQMPMRRREMKEKGG